jgi:2-polyprenyl-3-methyl-5-hydroxy-6-metoxy-1,4-benzoquinol methylase
MAYENRTYWKALHNVERGKLTAVGYSEMGEGFNRATYSLRLRAMFRLLERARLTAIDEVLEAAVGVGAYAPLWKSLAVRAWTGVDLSPDAISSLRERFPDDRFEVVDLTREGELASVLEQRTFEVVTAIDVLYHLVEEDAFTRALTGLAERVRSGGSLIVSDVFCPEPARVADHVLRRPFATYERILSPLGFSLVAREPVFGLLGDPVPRAGHPVRDAALYNAWRVFAKVVRTTPEPLRSPIGWALATALKPLDAALRMSGLSRGVNLELAAFRRR